MYSTCPAFVLNFTITWRNPGLRFVKEELRGICFSQIGLVRVLGKEQISQYHMSSYCFGHLVTDINFRLRTMITLHGEKLFFKFNILGGLSLFAIAAMSCGMHRMCRKEEERNENQPSYSVAMSNSLFKEGG